MKTTPDSVSTQITDQQQPTSIPPPISPIQEDMGCQDQLDIPDRIPKQEGYPSLQDDLKRKRK